ncbi:MAG: hypothetical protein FWH15_08610 [Betaproteobacteria bacterium]|nr:hypothetical protein [Betaproteobacteria bacterium]
MHTALDSMHDLELDRYVYDGHNLLAEVNELVVGYRHRIVQGSRRYIVRFAKPAAHAVIEEFPAAVAQLLQGEDIGFLRRVDKTALRTTLGLDLEQFENLNAYALITAHEVLIAYCAEEPTIQGNGS